MVTIQHWTVAELYFIYYAVWKCVKFPLHQVYNIVHYSCTSIYMELSLVVILLWIWCSMDLQCEKCIKVDVHIDLVSVFKDKTVVWKYKKLFNLTIIFCVLYAADTAFAWYNRTLNTVYGKSIWALHNCIWLEFLCK